MKIMKELENLSAEELQKRLLEIRKELLKFSVQVATGTTGTNVGKIRNAKKNIARLLTLLQRKEVLLP